MKADAGIIKEIDFDKIRKDFPVLGVSAHDRPIVYLDNGASSQMPRQVADRLDHYHRYEHANVHRGIHYLSQRATEAYEETRRKVQHFIGAPDTEEIIFTTGTTDSINLVANSFGSLHLKSGDRIVLSEMEHHANIVPWQMIAERTGAEIKVIPVSDKGEFDLDRFESLLNRRTKMVAITHVSNVLGTVNPVQEITELAHEYGAAVLLDGAQSAPHQPVDMQKLDCDFYAFSAHKMCGPTGFGILFGKRRHLESMPPYRGGGDMIDQVTFEKTTYHTIPYRFEAGTPPISAGIGFSAAIDYLNSIGMESIEAREQELLQYALEHLNNIDGLHIYGNADKRAAVISFTIDGIHPHDTGTLLDRQGVAVRTGHHCAQPLHTRLGVSATARATISFYNSREDIDRLVEGLLDVKSFF
ncbi:MAG: cysteine desulfurase [Balneolaceae bacterium]